MEVNNSHQNQYMNDSPKELNIPKYPLANNPNKSLKNTNYKNWLDTDELKGFSLVGPQPYSGTWATVIGSALGVAAVILSLSNPVTLVGALAAGAGITAALLPILWPDDSSGNAIFNDMMLVTSDMLDQALSGLVIAQANALLTGLKREIDAYQRALLFWQRNQQSQPAINEVVHRYHTLNSQFRTTISQFTLANYEVQLLPTYATIANLHLLHIRDGVKYADYWSLAFSDTDTEDTDASVFNGDFQHKELLHFMNEYTHYCTYWQYYALTEMEIAVGQNMGWDWIRYNDFRNLILTTVGDIVALFPTYDIRIYNMRLKMEILSRKIYSTPINFLNSGEDLHETDKKYRLPPQLYKKLYDIECHTSGTLHQYLTYYLSGHRSQYRSPAGVLSRGKMNGKESNINLTQIVPIGSDSTLGVGNIVSYSLRRTVNNPTNLIPSSVIQMVFENLRAGYSKYASNNPGIINKQEPLRATSSIPDQKITSNIYPIFDNHYLADMILADHDDTPSVTPIDQVKSYSFAWNHGSINSKNIVESMKNNEFQTSVFPAIKADELLRGMSVIEGYSHSGGDVLLSKFPNPTTGTEQSVLKFNFSVVGIPQGSSGVHFIRLRYASNYNVNINYDLRNSSGFAFNRSSQIRQTTFNHNSYRDLKLNEFSYFTSPQFVLENTQDWTYSLFITITHPTGSPTTGDRLFIIDKIEFVPRNPHGNNI